MVVIGPSPRRDDGVDRQFLAGGGEMGERIRAYDWSATPLGPVEAWPQSLKTVVRIMLTSRQPIWIGWGPELIKLYNDPYKAIVGGKHPGALGRPASVVWRDIWGDIEPMLRQVMEQNEGTYVESQLLIMERFGYPEETYYTFSYSPVPGDNGGVGGMICANTADTERVIGERQLNLLRVLAASAVSARSIDDVCQLSAASLAANAQDIPFAALYLVDVERRTASLKGAVGIEAGHPAAPPELSLDGDAIWPLGEAVGSGKLVIVRDLSRFGGALPSGVWRRGPHQVVAAPIASTGDRGPCAVLVAGLNPYRQFDESYQGFIELAAGQIAASIANVEAIEAERKRAEALAELDRAKTAFFSNVSHEFRTPLTLMLGPIEDALNDPATSAKDAARIAVAHRNALRLLKLVNVLLDFSRIEAGRVQTIFEPVDLATFTADLASGFRSAVEKAGLALVVDCPPLAEPVYVDHEMWEKIVLNLIANAFKYTFAGAITVSIQAAGDRIRLIVADTGIGIPAAELPHMFERFHRVRGAEGRTHEGTGIGLSLVHELVKMHCGAITVESELGKGSVFTVTIPAGTAHLPRERIAERQPPVTNAHASSLFVEEALRWLPDHGVAAEIAADSPIGDGSTAPSGPKPRILLADDNADMRDYISRLLTPRYEIESVANGQLALDAALANLPDLVLTDVMMPRLDGFGLLNELRRRPETAAIPVIVLSARAGEEARIEGVAAGADDYLIKPFSARELLARIGAHLEMARVRKRAQVATERERRRLYALFQQAPAVIAVLRGPEHVFELANPMFLRLIGQQRGEIIGRRVRDVVPEAIEQGFVDLLDRVYATGEPFIGDETPIKLARPETGEFDEVFLNVACLPYHGSSGTIRGLLVHAVDVTEQVRARQRIEELLKQKDDFIGVASHELKTPVTSVKAYAQSLERRFRRQGDIKSADQLAKLDTQLNKLTSLIGDLLDATRLNSDRLQFQAEWFDLDALIAEVVEELQHTTEQHVIRCEGETRATIWADRERIGQVLANFLSNAIKYSPRADSIIVRSSSDGRSVTISVQDFGVGIAEDERERVFERFYRSAGPTQETFPGLGLGLFVSAEIIRRQGGRIWAESELGRGSTFSFQLPIGGPVEPHA